MSDGVLPLPEGMSAGNAAVAGSAILSSTDSLLISIRISISASFGTAKYFDTEFSVGVPADEGRKADELVLFSTSKEKE